MDYVDYQSTIHENGYPNPCDCFENPPASTFYTSLNSNIPNLEFNANGGYANYGTLQNGVGQDIHTGIHWYHAYDPGNLYRGGQVPNNCYVQNWGGGPYANCGIVYDALGGARRAYTVRTGFWYNGQTGLGQGWAKQGGPTSWLGMPISNEVINPSGYAEQFFVGGYYRWMGACQANYWNVCSPGWTDHGWDPVYSYQVADAWIAAGNIWGIGQPTGYAYEDGYYWKQPCQNGTVQVEIPSGTVGGAGGGPQVPDPSPTLPPSDPLVVNISTGRLCVSNVYEDPTYCIARGYTANKLVDGNTLSLAYPGGHDVDYTVTFDGYDFIRQFSVRFGYFGFAGYIDSWEILALNPDGTSWQQLHSGGCPNTDNFSGEVAHPTRAIRIKAHSNANWIGLYELTVNGHHNTAIGMPVEQLTGGDPNYDKDPGRLTDGNLATDAYPASTSFTYRVTYPQTMDVSYLVLAGKEYTANPAYITSWSVLGFDGTDWVGIASGTNDGRQYIIVPVFSQLFCLRINCSSTQNWIGLYELGVYGNVSGFPKVTEGPGDETCLPTTFSLSQNYPNPFNPATVISYSLPEATHVTLDVFNILGQKVATLINENQTAGEHNCTWVAREQASGIYFYRLATDHESVTKKMVLLK
ncbi:MAG: T9SS type A sorting domain-containing protein [Patescibacteria group bacterium]